VGGTTSSQKCIHLKRKSFKKRTSVGLRKEKLYETVLLQQCLGFMLCLNNKHYCIEIGSFPVNFSDIFETSISVNYSIDKVLEQELRLYQLAQPELLFVRQAHTVRMWGLIA